jgi:iron(III) transport system substrate-binding protein
MTRARPLVLAVAVASLVALAGCSDSGGSSGSDTDLTVYSGRSEEQVADLVSRFEDESGYTVNMRYGDTAELAVQLVEEGDQSPADVFWAQDAGALSAVDEAGMLTELDAQTLKRVPDQYQAADGRWVGTSGRARVYVYDPSAVQEADLPQSVLELTDPEWDGSVAIAPTNGSFQAFVTALRAAEGEDVARQWLTELKAGGAQAFESNDLILEAVDNGEVPLGLVNHYYWYQQAAEVGEDAMQAKVGFFEPGDPGSLVNVAGAGILQDAADSEAAQEFVDFLLEDESQRYIVDVAAEYALVDGIEAREGLPELSTLEGPNVELYELSDLEGTLQLLTETGWI